MGKVAKSKKGVLTQKQKEVISLIADGYTELEIAEILELSHSTIMSHRNEIKLRLNIQDKAGLVKYVLQNNLTTLESGRTNTSFKID